LDLAHVCKCALGRQHERFQIIFKKSFVEFLEEGGVTPLGGGKKRVKMKEWRGINEKKGVGSS
jgi:hypothetical protein